MARGGYRVNNGFSQNARKTTDDMTKRSMNITKKEEIDKKFEDKLIDWCTFYRRNIHRFAEHYLGIRLHFYQKIMLYLMNLCPQVVILCSRASAKSFITALYACCVCILYPNSKVLVSALTKKQAGLCY